MRWPKATAGLVCLRLPRLLLDVGVYFSLVRISKMLPTWTTWDIWSGTIRESGVESVWRVDQVFPCRVYIDLNCRNFRIWVSLVWGNHHIDNFMSLISLIVTDVVLINTLNSFEMFWIEIKLESKDSLLAWIWHSIELILWSSAY
jgi:hypothetical protein